MGGEKPTITGSIRYITGNDGRLVHRAEIVKAEIHPRHLVAPGSTENKAVAANIEHIRRLGGIPERGDEAGHSVPARAGGQSGPSGNKHFIPQYHRTNMAQAVVEDRMVDFIRRTGQIVSWEVRHFYNNENNGHPYATIITVNNPNFIDEKDVTGPASYLLFNPQGEEDMFARWSATVDGRLDHPFEEESRLLRMFFDTRGVVVQGLPPFRDVPVGQGGRTCA